MNIGMFSLELDKHLRILGGINAHDIKRKTTKESLQLVTKILNPTKLTNNKMPSHS